MHAKKKLRAAVVLAAIAMTPVASATPAFAYLKQGPVYQYPAEGGIWEYGFWYTTVRSYYTVNRCHGSTVVYNGTSVRSINTASGAKSIAEKSAINLPQNDDRYYYRTC